MVFFKAINTLSTFLMLPTKKENAKTLATHRCELAKGRKLRAKHSQTEQFNVYQTWPTLYLLLVSEMGELFMEPTHAAGGTFLI